MDCRPDALGPHNAQLSHDGQVLADLRLARPCRFDQVLDRTWPLTQQGEEFQACRFSQDLAEVGLQSIELLFLLAFHLLAPFCCSPAYRSFRIPACDKTVYKKLAHLQQASFGPLHHLARGVPARSVRVIIADGSHAHQTREASLTPVPAARYASRPG